MGSSTLKILFILLCCVSPFNKILFFLSFSLNEISFVVKVTLFLLFFDMITINIFLFMGISFLLKKSSEYF